MRASWHRRRCRTISCYCGSMLVFSSGQDVFGIPDASAQRPEYPPPSYAKAKSRPWRPGTARLRWPLATSGIRDHRWRHMMARRWPTLGERPARCITAMAFADADDAVCLCRFERRMGPRTGSAISWRCGQPVRSGGSICAARQRVCVADRLAYPNGILVQGDALDRVGELGRIGYCALRPAARGGRRRPFSKIFPAIPAGSRGRRTAVHGWRSSRREVSSLNSCCGSARYCTRMMREVPQALWIAPTLRAGVSFKEPMQGGAVKVHGIFKPWAPTRSYGLAVRTRCRLCAGALIS